MRTRLTTANIRRVMAQLHIAAWSAALIASAPASVLADQHPSDFNGSWSGQFDVGPIAVGTIKLVHNGDQVNGTLGIDLERAEPLDQANSILLHGRQLAGSHRVAGTFAQPSGAAGEFELTLLSNGALDGSWRSSSQTWIMRESPRSNIGDTTASSERSVPETRVIHELVIDLMMTDQP